jgi:ferritin-like protein
MKANLKTNTIQKSYLENKKLIEKILSNLSHSIAKEVYYALILAKFIPEIESINKGKIKALKGKEIDNFLDRLIRS